MNTYKNFGTRVTPQSEPIPGTNQVMNNAGGYGWQITKWQQLERFLILGTEGGTYYVGEQELTRENAYTVMECVVEDGIRTVDTIVSVSAQGRAPKNDPALFALAICASLGNLATKRHAFMALPKVARIGTHLFHFAQYISQFRGKGKLYKKGIQRWYQEKDPGNLAYQVAKYQQRDGWSHKDLLRLTKPVPASESHQDIYSWVVGKNPEPKTPFLAAVEAVKKATTTREVCGLIHDYSLPREVIPTQWLNDMAVWSTMLWHMPVTAMVRNLGKMSSLNLLNDFSDETAHVISTLTDEAIIRASRIHPLQVLQAIAVYEQGHGLKGSLTWSPVGKIVDALNTAFYSSFGNVQPANKRTLLALDVSGSMSSGWIAGMEPISPRVGSAAMAMVTARTEPRYGVIGFTGGITPLSITPNQRLDDIVDTISNLPFDRTDCAQPMLYAIKKGLEIDTFVIYTDNETWFGRIHPVQALHQYREKTGIPAKLVVVGMTATRFSIADPSDAGMLDVVGFDTAAPNIISDFSRE